MKFTDLTKIQQIIILTDLANLRPSPSCFEITESQERVSNDAILIGWGLTVPPTLARLQRAQSINIARKEEPIVANTTWNPDRASYALHFTYANRETDNVRLSFNLISPDEIVKDVSIDRFGISSNIGIVEPLAKSLPKVAKFISKFEALLKQEHDVAEIIKTLSSYLPEAMNLPPEIIQQYYVDNLSSIRFDTIIKNLTCHVDDFNDSDMVNESDSDAGIVPNYVTNAQWNNRVTTYCTAERFNPNQYRLVIGFGCNNSDTLEVGYVFNYKEQITISEINIQDIESLDEFLATVREHIEKSVNDSDVSEHLKPFLDNFLYVYDASKPLIVRDMLKYDASDKTKGIRL